MSPKVQEVNLNRSFFFRKILKIETLVIKEWKSYFNAANALSQMGSSCKLEDLQAAAAQAAAAGHQRAGLYWPGIQGLISNPNIWRERLALNGKLKVIIFKTLILSFAIA